MKWFVGLVGGALLLVGIILGNVEVTAGPESTSCGTAFRPDYNKAHGADNSTGWRLPGRVAGIDVQPYFIEETDVVGDCEDAIGSRTPWAWLLIGGGAILALGGIVVHPRGRQ